MIKKLVRSYKNGAWFSWQKFRDLKKHRLDLKDGDGRYVIFPSYQAKLLYNFLRQIFGKEKKLDREKVLKLICMVHCGHTYTNRDCVVVCAEPKNIADAFTAKDADIYVKED